MPRKIKPARGGKRDGAGRPPKTGGVRARITILKETQKILTQNALFTESLGDAVDKIVAEWAVFTAKNKFVKKVKEIC